jgi:hypothetical protein
MPTANHAYACEHTMKTEKLFFDKALVPHPGKFSHELSFKIEVISLILPVVAQPPG